ncbi:MAG: hypothetical protein ACOVN0_22010 [Niveispirillum sp.]|uniref:hypothetical protein n=1 Tax=Niveispirillum sp. TaxID=1917217 RepID=UPI003BA7DCC8
MINNDEMTINVHIDEVAHGGIISYQWYYNNMTGDGISLGVPKNVRKIKFALDDSSKALYTLTMPKITPKQGDAGYYNDLLIPTENALQTGDYVLVHDGQINAGVTVGSVTLGMALRDGHFGSNVDQKTIYSDPEVINTGKEA